MMLHGCSICISLRTHDPSFHTLIGHRPLVSIWFHVFYMHPNIYCLSKVSSHLWETPTGSKRFQMFCQGCWSRGTCYGSIAQAGNVFSPHWFPFLWSFMKDTLVPSWVFWYQTGDAFPPPSNKRWGLVWPARENYPGQILWPESCPIKIVWTVFWFTCKTRNIKYGKIEWLSSKYRRK